MQLLGGGFAPKIPNPERESCTPAGDRPTALLKTIDRNDIKTQVGEQRFSEAVEGSREPDWKGSRLAGLMRPAGLQLDNSHSQH